MGWKDMFKDKNNAVTEEASCLIQEDPDLEKEALLSEPESSPAGQNEVKVVLEVHFNQESQVGRAALFLAAASKNEELPIKNALSELGWRCVATEVGGVYGDLPQKVSRALVGAALNSGVITKTASEMHALMHAAHEALNSFLPLGLLESSVGAKIAIVRSPSWIAVAVSGDTAYHAVAHHERFGCGVMHL